MRAKARLFGVWALAVGLWAPAGLRADFLLFDTGAPDAKIGMASRPSTPGSAEIEAADDFIANGWTINSATFTGLLVPSGAGTPTVSQVVVEMYRVFPKDSDTGRTITVPTRTNSPSDNAFDSRDSGATPASLTFTTTTLGTNVTAANSVLSGIHPSPNQTTGGEGPVTGTEVQFNVTFKAPFFLPADHYFFVPQVAVNGGQFYWLSAPKPLTTPSAFTPDLQAWIRNAALDPDWLRVGTDVVGPVNGVTPTFNGTFSLTGLPEPSSVVLFALGAAGLAGVSLRGRGRRPVG